MLILTGTALVLLTWAVCLLGLMVLGLPLAALTRRGPLGLADLRRGLWWGLLLITVGVYVGNLVWPVGSGTMAVAVVAIVLGAGCVADCRGASSRLARAGAGAGLDRSSGWRSRQRWCISQWQHSGR